jgi:hypothetical protein
VLDAGENYSDTKHTVPELLNRFAADGWELASLQDYRQGGDGSRQWEATQLLTAYTFKRPVAAELVRLRVSARPESVARNRK